MAFLLGIGVGRVFSFLSWIGAACRQERRRTPTTRQQDPKEICETRSNSNKELTAPPKMGEVGTAAPLQRREEGKAAPQKDGREASPRRRDGIHEKNTPALLQHLLSNCNFKRSLFFDYTKKDLLQDAECESASKNVCKKRPNTTDHGQSPSSHA